jgi:uncharacterized protein (DUF302 family)
VPSTPPSAEGVVTKPGGHSVDDTVARLTALIDGKGLKLFAVIDHSGEAARAGLTMPATKVVIFGSPAAGTPVMLAAPLVALELPLKVLVWADADGAVAVSYDSPAYLAVRYGLSDELRHRLEPIEALTDALVGTGG